MPSDPSGKTRTALEQLRAMGLEHGRNLFVDVVERQPPVSEEEIARAVLDSLNEIAAGNYEDITDEDD